MVKVGIVSLLILFGVIVLGLIRKTNIGILAIGSTIILAELYGIDSKEIISGFSSNLFLTMTGVSYLFGILSDNKTLETLSRRIVSLFGNHRMIIPVLIFLLGALLSGLGPGPVPILAVIPALVVPVALSTGLNPIMLCMVGQAGAMGGRMSPLTPDYAVVMSLIPSHHTDASINFYLSSILTGFFIALSVFIYYKGWKIDKSLDTTELERVDFNKKQIISLGGLLFMVTGVILFHLNVGLTSFAVGSILCLLNVGDEQAGIQNIPWNVILLVLGVGVLMNIVVISGGTDLIAKRLTGIMNERTAPGFMIIGASIISFFCSGIGVVFPTLIPTSIAIGNSFGSVSLTNQLISMVIVGGTFTGFSPFTTAGALILAAVASNKSLADKYPQRKLFLELLIFSIYIIILEGLLAFLGFYSLLF